MYYLFKFVCINNRVYIFTHNNLFFIYLYYDNVFKNLQKFTFIFILITFSKITAPTYTISL